uniref:Uncharacterized protein n=1 Tax=Clytia hemisphaerica TaxID=252671 RepID=A0A7M5XJT7_9CNID|eukprot:TCONS_00056130-protein
MLRLADREGWTVVKLYKQNLLVSSGALKEKQVKEARKSAENSNKTLKLNRENQTGHLVLMTLCVTIIKKLAIIRHIVLSCKRNIHKFQNCQKVHRHQRVLAGTVHQIPHHQSQKAEEIGD